ncbi:MAG: BatD family protein [Verrucomicrobiae bacterium]|nr:BatD family protein [Verrucomicrobiae bacterium]
MRFFSVIFLFLIAQCAPLASAQTVDPQVPTDDSVTVNVLRDRIAVGEIGQLFIKVRNAEASMPERIETQGLDVTFSGQQSSINIVNGRQSVETTYFYRFRGDDPGTFTIPEFEIRLSQRGGESVAKTRPIVITLVENSDPESALDATKPFFGKLELTRDTFYVNELVPFTLTAYVRGRNSIHDVVTAKLENESFIFRGFRDVRTDGAEVGHTYYSSAVIPSHLFALKAGSHRLGPAQIVVRSVDSDPGGFGLSSFFQRTATREMATNTLNLTVKPLPDGAPASFTGGVGDFQLSGTPSLTTLGIGDPVSMEFEVTGIGNLRTMGAPVFAIPQTGIWRTYEPNKKLNDDEDSDGFRTGTIRFSQVLIPEARTDKIPEFQLSYFDPAKESYVTLKAGPFPISMTGSASPSAEPTAPFPADGSSALSSPAAPAKRPEPRFEDILHIRTGPARWLAAAPSGKPGALFWGVQIVFSIAFSTLAAFGVIRWLAWRRLHESLQPVEELPFARQVKQLPRPGSPRREFLRSINAALAAWTREHPDAPSPVLEAVTRISERCDAALYSGQSQPDVPISASEAEEFLSLIRRLPVR